jgi:hypothetical protein
MKSDLFYPLMIGFCILLQIVVLAFCKNFGATLKQFFLPISFSLANVGMYAFYEDKYAVGLLWFMNVYFILMSNMLFKLKQ